LIALIWVSSLEHCGIGIGKDLAVLLTHDVDSPWRYRCWRPPLKAIARATTDGKLFAEGARYIWDWVASSLKIKPDTGCTFQE